MLGIFSTFAGAVVLGAPIAFALILSCIAYLLVTGQHLGTLSSYLFAALNSSSLLAIPFFILSAEILNRCGATKRLVEFVDAWMGHNRGGLPVVSVVTVTFFAAISGSSAATAGAVGSILIPEMTRRGYDPKMAVGLIATAGGLGILIPPSVPVIIYGTVTETSISDLFQATLVPGLALAFLLAIAAYIMGVRSGVAPEPRRSAAERYQATKRAVGVLFLPVIIFGGIYTGIFTATESAAVACVYSLLLAIFGFRTPLSQLPRMLTYAAATSALIMIIIAAANLFSYVLTSERIPHVVFQWITGMELSRIELLSLLMLFFIVCGMFFEVISVILITMPILVPVLQAMDVSLLFFAIILVLNMELAVITPPIGLNLFVISAISKIPVIQVFRGAAPFALIILGLLMAIILIPGGESIVFTW
ncbi:MAG: TRAP transporter large permease [Burkholderiaceae bacterium]